MNEGVIVSVHGYAGDAHQARILLPMFEHHQAPIVIISPEDSPIEALGPHICVFAGKRAYIGQDSWDRQLLQMKRLLDFPADFYFMNDSDSFCLTPELPRYLFDHPDVFFSNQVTDFRVPGQTWTDEHSSTTWSTNYHEGYPLIAMQPPYFCSRPTLEKLVAVGPRPACPLTPFIDWMMVEYCINAGVQYHPFERGASCETITPNGREQMRQCILDRGATMIHSVKSQEALNDILVTYEQSKGIK